MRKYIIKRKISIALLGHKQQRDLFAQKSVVEKSAIKIGHYFSKQSILKIEVIKNCQPEKMFL